MATQENKCGHCESTFPVIYVDEKSGENYFFHSDVCRVAFLEGKEPARKAPKGYRHFTPLCHQCKTPMDLTQFNKKFCSLKCLRVIREEVRAIQREYEKEQSRKMSQSGGSYNSGAGNCH